jgi:F-type H+-transporting ATPase subunit b
MSGRVLRPLFLGVALAASAFVVRPAHADEPAAKHAEVAAQGTGATAAPSEADEEHAVPKIEDYNFFYGFLGERDDVEPSILWRPKGTPVPFAAMMLNSAILYWLLIRFAKKPISDALKARKTNILRGMEEAGKMKSDAEAQLAHYEQKLANVDQDIERVRTDMRSAGESERKRILAEAKEKRTRMEKDAQTLISQELKAAREALTGEMVRAALSSAENTLRSKVTEADQNRLAEEYLASIKTTATALRGKL